MGIPKRKYKKSPQKGGGGIKQYDTISYRPLPFYTRSCNSSGCRITNGPGTTSRIAKRRTLVFTTASVNNKTARPWRTYRYYTRRHFGAPHQRFSKSWWVGFGQNDYGNLVANATHVYDSGLAGYDVPFSLVSFSEPSTASTANAIALAKLQSSLKEARTQWNLAVTLGEARETARMIAHTANRIGSAYLSFRKGRIADSWRQLRGKDRVPVNHQENFRSLKRRANRDTWADEVSSAWMEYSYGWTPLLGDVDSAAKYLAEKRVRGYFPVQEVSRAHRIAETLAVPQGTGNSYLLRDRTWRNSHCRYTYEVSPQWAKQPNTLDSLGFTDPATLAWELLPLSFVTDWFVNVGQVLESLFEFRQWRVIRGIKSSRSRVSQERSMTRNWAKPNGAPTPQAVELHPEQYMVYQWCDRTTLGSLPTSVPLRIKVANPFDLKLGQLATSIVLLRYAFRN